jgi:hypothetical protein
MHDNKFQHPVDGRDEIWFSIDFCDRIQIVAETNENKILLGRQFRFGSKELSLELPAGPELLEEMGYVGQNARTIATLHHSRGVQINKPHIVHVGKCE